MLVNGNLQMILEAIVANGPTIREGERKLMSKQMSLTSEKSFLSSACSPEHFIVSKSSDSTVLLASAAKGTEAAISDCYPQLLCVCGSAALSLYYDEGVALGDAAVLGLAISDSGLQICGFYLMETHFPVMAVLTPVLNPIGS